MTFHFDADLAAEYGVNEAVFVHHIFYWISHNEANRKHFYKERYWTYNSKKAFTELFPFWTYDQLKRIIKNLVEKSVLMTDNFNENTWDKTIWYSLSDEVLNYYKNSDKANKIALGRITQSNGQKTPIEWANNTNRIGKTHQSNIGTDIIPYIKPDREGSLAFFEVNFPERFDALMMKFKSKITDFVKFAEMFEATVMQERLEYEPDVLEGRFRKFARNWIDNQSRYGVKEVEVVQLNKKIGKPA